MGGGSRPFASTSTWKVSGAAHDDNGDDLSGAPVHGGSDAGIGGQSSDMDGQGQGHAAAGRRRVSASADDGRGAHNHGGALGELLECAVGTPIKEGDGTKDAFISYLITTHHTQVRRRFTDFVYLHKTLTRDHVACAIPPMPTKERMEYIRGDRFGHDFTSRRAKSLQRFLFRLTQHPVLRRAEILHLFLESNDWNATMNRRSARNSVTEGSGGGAGGNGGGGGGGGPGSSMFENLTDSLINAFSKVHRPNQRFIEVRDRCSQLEDNLSHVEKVVSRVARREGELEADLRDLAEQFQKLISLEPGVEDEVRTFAASVEDTAAAWKRLHDMTDQDYVGSLYDMQAYSVAFKALLKAREQKQVDHEQLVDYLSKAQADRDSLLGTSGGGGGANGNGGNGASGSGNGGGGGGLSASAFSAVSTNAASSFLRSRLESMSHGSMDPELARRERIRKLEMDVDRLTPEVSAAKRTTELFDEEVVRESGDFERIRRVEFKNQLRGLADAQIGLCDEVTAVWERYIREMDDVAPRVERQDARAS